MEKNEAARVALAIGVLIDWIARTAERLDKIESKQAQTDYDYQHIFTEFEIRITRLERSENDA